MDNERKVVDGEMFGAPLPGRWPGANERDSRSLVRRALGVLLLPAWWRRKRA